jgi:hypothetical protein
MFFLANVTLPRPIPYSFTVTSFTGSVELCVLCARGDRSPNPLNLIALPAVTH